MGFPSRRVGGLGGLTGVWIQLFAGGRATLDRLERGGAMDEDRRASRLSGWDLQAAAGFTLLTFVYAWLLPRLPDRVPIHFDGRGRANGWTDKAHLPWVILAIPLLFWLLLWGIGWIGSKIETEAAGATALASASAFEPLRGFLGLGMALLMMGCLAAPVLGTVTILVGVAVFFLCLVLGIAFMAREMRRAFAHLPKGKHDRWGLFYRNPEDPRLWVEKRLGVGWTLNYAHRAAWWVTALLLLPMFAVLGLVISLRK